MNGQIRLTKAGYRLFQGFSWLGVTILAVAIAILLTFESLTLVAAAVVAALALLGQRIIFASDRALKPVAAKYNK